MASAHDQLEALNHRVADAEQAERDAEAAAYAADAQVEVARDAVRDCHDLGEDATEATENLELAKQAAEQAYLKLEGVARRDETRRLYGGRLHRVTIERQRFLEENGDRLIAELGPEGDEATDAIVTYLEAALRADDQWHAVARKGAGYLHSMSVNVRANQAGDHQLSPLLKRIRVALRDMDEPLTSPVPHMRGTEAGAWVAQQAAKHGAKAKQQDELEIVHG